MTMRRIWSRNMFGHDEKRCHETRSCDLIVPLFLTSSMSLHAVVMKKSILYTCGWQCYIGIFNNVL